MFLLSSFYLPNLTYYFRTCGKCCEGFITEDGAIMNITRKKYQHGQGIYLQIDGRTRTFSTVIFENSALYEPAYFLKSGQLIRYTRIEQDKHCDLVRIIKL